MSKYTPYKDVAMLALSSMSVLNSEWQLAIQGLPTIDIVRCGECKYWHNETDMTYCDRTVWFGTDAYDYCSFGERGGE